MTESDHRLLRQLTIAIALKVVLLALLWQFFVSDQGVAVDSVRAAEAIAPATGVPPSTTHEASHDQ